MSRFRVLVSCPLIQDSIDEFDAEFADAGIDYYVRPVDQRLEEPELLSLLPEYDGIIAGDDELTAAVLDDAPRLKVISKWGIGTDNIDQAAADRNDVVVYNTPGAFSAEVADVVVGYAIMLTRELHRIDAAVRDGDWFCPRGVSLAGRTFGVLGVGNIGATVARRAHALGMDVVGHDVEPLPDSLEADVGIEAVGVDELFERSSVVSLNCALTDETRRLVGEAELTRLGADGYLINTSRGEVVDQRVLVDALRRGTIAGAALDVFETEPLPPSDPLTELDNVILGSHNAQNTTEAVDRVNERAVHNLLEGLRSQDE